MSLKLFRSTGYSSILSPGEARVAIHPGWVVAGVSAWVGLACNVALWRALGSGNGPLLRALLLGAFIAAGCGALLSFLGWRKTLKPAATLALFLFALAACAIWTQGLAVDGSLLDKGAGTLFVPPWASFLRWQVPLLLVVLGVLPTVWVWHANVRRLPGPKQLGTNMTGALGACALLAVTGFLLFRGIS